MGKDFKKNVITIIILIAIGFGVWYGLKWFGETAGDNASDPTGGYEERVDNEAEK